MDLSKCFAPTLISNPCLAPQAQRKLRATWTTLAELILALVGGVGVGDVVALSTSCPSKIGSVCWRLTLNIQKYSKVKSLQICSESNHLHSNHIHPWYKVLACNHTFLSTVSGATTTALLLFSSTQCFISFRHQKLRCAYDPEGSPLRSFPLRTDVKCCYSPSTSPKKRNFLSGLTTRPESVTKWPIRSCRNSFKKAQTKIQRQRWSCRGDWTLKSWLVDKDPYSGL